MSRPYDWEHEEALEAAWAENVAMWELSLIGTPGLYASLRSMECLEAFLDRDGNSQQFVEWYRGTVQ